MLRGEGSYYTPITSNGQVVEKRVDAIRVTKEASHPHVSVTYTLTNPYRHPISVPIQSALTMLYQYAEQEGSHREPELHVVPATVTQHSSDELLYVAEGTGSLFGTTAIQRQHLGTGIPNYRHPVAVTVTLVPGDSVVLEAEATIPEGVEKMILVDAMVGPNRPYGIYPQLLEHPMNEGKIPPPLRVYQGATFSQDPPLVHMPSPAAMGPGGARRRTADRLPRWIDPQVFARLQAALRQTGKIWCYAIGGAAALLAFSMAGRLADSGSTTRIIIEAARGGIFLTLGIIAGHGRRVARIALASLLGLNGAIGTGELVALVVQGTYPWTLLLTSVSLIPMLYLVGAALLTFSTTIRSHTGPR